MIAFTAAFGETVRIFTFLKAAVSGDSGGT